MALLVLPCEKLPMAIPNPCVCLGIMVLVGSGKHCPDPWALCNESKVSATTAVGRRFHTQKTRGVPGATMRLAPLIIGVKPVARTRRDLARLDPVLECGQPNQRFPGASVAGRESAGDNLSATFCPSVRT